MLSAALVSAWLIIQGAYGQNYRGRVQGTVLDASQGVVTDANVRLTNDDTGVAAVRKSDTSGRYLFDFVEPGIYTITVEQTGFSKFVQENIVVQISGDVTVDPVLRIGRVAESVTVSAVPTEVQFNTTSVSMVIDRKMLDNLPVLTRNPLALALTDPVVTNYYTPALILPFNKWQNAAWVVAGGNTGGNNDILVDGTPTQIGGADSYVPPVDAVQELTVQQNSVDAESGHSAGGIFNLSMRSGTNALHGSVYYYGRNPALNAQSNSVAHVKNVARYNTWGATAGGPIKKNRLFTFGAYEGLRATEPRHAIFTLHTALERQGDFSKSLNTNSALRTIYDPFSTQFDPVTGTVTRQPFPDNKVPQERMDPTALNILPDIWLPNSPGDDQTGVNNYKIGYPRYFNYWNVSNRTDWNINDKWRVFGRYSLYHHTRDPVNYAHSPAAPINAYKVQASNYAGEAIASLSPTTILTFGASYAFVLDQLRGGTTEIGAAGLAKLWSNQWYQSYLKDVPIVFFPGLYFGGTQLGRAEAWNEQANTYSVHTRLSKQQGAHYLKVGMEWRHTRGTPYYPQMMTFNFSAADTSNTFINPDTSLSGDPYASFLLGVPTSESSAHYTPRPQVSLSSYGYYFQDDWKVSKRLTLNLGVRYEYQTPQKEEQDRISRFVDLTNPIPELQSNPPQFPADALALRTSAPIYNGAWMFADSRHRAVYNTAKNLFLPRLGVAFRLTDKSAIRIGWARFVTPIENVGPPIIGGNVLAGFDATTNVLGPLEGVPRDRLSDPFPANNPLIQPVGRAYGRYMNLGNSAEWFDQNLLPPQNDRISISFQRQLPQQIRLDVTYFYNRGFDYNYTKDLDQLDPALYYRYQAQLFNAVANPFFNYLTVDKFPGSLRYQDQVSLISLLTPYPQYQGLLQDATNRMSERYHSLKIQAQRVFSKGYTLSIGYNYGYDKSQVFFNDIEQFANHLTYIPSDSPRHRLVASGAIDVPFGKGRPWLKDANPFLDKVVGGWTVSPILTISSGQFLDFPQAIVSGRPKVFRKRDNWFDTSVFSPPEDFTPRTNPYLYPGVTGPRFWNIDMTLSKTFPIREQLRLEFRMEAYNLTNSFIPMQPVTDIYDYSFGRSTDQSNTGREMQYALRLHF